MDKIFDSFDIILSPSLPGEAPVGLTEVRTATFARLWTQMYTPSINFPLFEGPNGLPICFQMVGKRNTDDALLANAQWADAQLRAALLEIPMKVRLFKKPEIPISDDKGRDSAIERCDNSCLRSHGNGGK